MKIGLLISGNLGLAVFEELSKFHNINFILTDKNSKEIIKLSQKYGLPVFIGNPRNGNATNFIIGKEIEVLISVNYIFVIEKDIINLPQKIAFNVHGSLLPKYRGRTPHVWAIINGEKKTGITAHIIDEGCDMGDIIEQMEIDIDIKDTGATILKKYETYYLPIIERVIQKIENGKLKTIKQNNKKATYFGKRTPKDGQIRWDWQKERIHNWVRAQACPYPGAFTYFNDSKIVIDEIEFSEKGYSYDIINGTIIDIDEYPYVKTPNGVICINKIRDYNRTDFKINEILG